MDNEVCKSKIQRKFKQFLIYQLPFSLYLMNHNWEKGQLSHSSKQIHRKKKFWNGNTWREVIHEAWHYHLLLLHLMVNHMKSEHAISSCAWHQILKLNSSFFCRSHAHKLHIEANLINGTYANLKQKVSQNNKLQEKQEIYQELLQLKGLVSISFQFQQPADYRLLIID